MLGKIDLDPASCEEANRTVKATNYYTIHSNGLLHTWRGLVWLNPPFGTSAATNNAGDSNIKLFTEKLVESYERGLVEQAILLARADPSAYWFAQLWNYPICFVSKNFYFDGPAGKGSIKHRFGTCFVYFGTNEEKFIEVFNQFGNVVKRVT